MPQGPVSSTAWVLLAPNECNPAWFSCSLTIPKRFRSSSDSRSDIDAQDVGTGREDTSRGPRDPAALSVPGTFYYPTGQPVPLSALQLREALDEAAFAHRVRRPMILVGHSMGGVLARAQVSRLTTAQAEEILPNVSNLPPSSRLRRCLVFEPRRDVSRVIFICTPHRGSRLAVGSFGGLAISLIRLPGWIADEMADFAGQALPGMGHVCQRAFTASRHTPDFLGP